MIDIHAHILPCVDDGSNSLQESLEMLKEAQNLGVTDIILTPHFRLNMFTTEAAEDKRVFAAFKNKAKEEGINVNLYLGQEVHFDKPMLALLRAGKALTLNGTQSVLLEFPFREEEDIEEAVYGYKIRGFNVIVAHYERYTYATIEGAKAIKRQGGEIQINAYTILGKEGDRAKKLAREMIKKGLVDYVASDVHSFKSNDLLEAFKFVSKKFGKDTAEKLFNENAKKLLLK